MLYEEHNSSSFTDNSKPMTGIILLDHPPQCGIFQYWCNYAADWLRFIEFTEIVEDCTEALPPFLSGGASPDKAGGIQGFAEFLDKSKMETTAITMKLSVSLSFMVLSHMTLTR